MDVKPIYIVSGFPRSGTSMMMRCLEAGGIPCIYSTKHDNNLNKSSSIFGYVPNPYGYYETATRGERIKNWASYTGHAIKLLHEELGCIRDDFPCRAIYLWRDPNEIRQSFSSLVSEPKHNNAFIFLDDYEMKVAKDVEYLLTKCLDVKVLRYPDIIAEPLKQLTKLNWPIDKTKAIGCIDPSLYRFRNNGYCSNTTEI